MDKGDIVRITAIGMYCENYEGEYLGVLGTLEPVRHLIRFTEPNGEEIEYDYFANDQFELVEETPRLYKCSYCQLTATMKPKYVDCRERTHGGWLHAWELVPNDDELKEEYKKRSDFSRWANV